MGSWDAARDERWSLLPSHLPGCPCPPLRPGRQRRSAFATLVLSLRCFSAQALRVSSSGSCHSLSAWSWFSCLERGIPVAHAVCSCVCALVLGFGALPSILPTLHPTSSENNFRLRPGLVPVRHADCGCPRVAHWYACGASRIFVSCLWKWSLRLLGWGLSARSSVRFYLSSPFCTFLGCVRVCLAVLC